MDCGPLAIPSSTMAESSIVLKPSPVLQIDPAPKKTTRNSDHNGPRRAEQQMQTDKPLSDHGNIARKSVAGQ